MSTRTRSKAPCPGSRASVAGAAQGSGEGWAAVKIGADISILELILITDGLTRLLSLSLFQKLLLQVRPLQKV